MILSYNYEKDNIYYNNILLLYTTNNIINETLIKMKEYILLDDNSIFDSLI